MKNETMRRRMRLLRYAFYVLCLIPLCYFSFKYEIDEIPEFYERLRPQGMPPGTKIVMIDCKEDTSLFLGSVILYRPPGVDDGKMYFGVIAGLPGELIELEGYDGTRATLIVGDRTEEVSMPPTTRLLPGKIREGTYLLLNGDRYLSPELTHVDSRVFGCVERSRFAKKVVVPLTFF